jgi:hypothetical protein
MVYGLISDVNEVENIDSGTATLTITSFFDRLNKKAVNTEKYSGSGSNTVLSDVAGTYLGVPAALTDFNALENKIEGPIEGNSAFQELQKIAQTGYSHLFVQVGGILTAEPWKDHNSIVDFYIPQQLITSARKINRNDPPPSFIKVSGAVKSVYDCGNGIFTDSRISDGSGGYQSTGGPLGVCVKTGVSQAGKRIQLGNLKGNSEDLKNASYLINGTSLERLISARDGELEFNVEGEDSGNNFWLGQGITNFNLVVFGNSRPRYEFDSKSSYNQNERINVGNPAVNNFISAFIPAYNYSFPGLSESPVHYSDEATEGPIETFVYDSGLAALYGLSWEQIDNPYVPCKESLFKIGIRRFQEWKMQNRTWELEMPVVPCIRLNDVVVFETPDREDSPTRTIKGVVHSIRYSYTADPIGMTMTLGVMSMEDIGSTLYQSGNLIQDFCANGDSGNTDNTASIWTTTGGIVLGTHQSDISDNCFWHFFEAGAVGGITTLLAQGDIDSSGDALYTVSFDAEYVTGSTPITTTLNVFDSMGALGSTSVLTDGTYSVSFTGRDSPVSFQWISLPSDPNGYYLEICNIQLTAIVTA